MDMHGPEMTSLFEAILSLESPEECAMFFEDICTIKELQAMAQRLQVAELLESGKNYVEIYQDTGVSSATICRVNKCLMYGSGGYRTALSRMKQAEGNSENR